MRYGMAIDLDRCTGCGACSIACAVENNVPATPSGTDDRKGLTLLRVHPAANGKDFPEGRTAFIPVSCQHCGHETPCVAVCPQNAVDVDRENGIVSQIPARCLGCRYCMAACPYHARSFNWWDPSWPEGAEAALNPDVAPRMRGVVEKCNFCHGRLHAAKAKANAAGRRTIDPADYVPACVEACPEGAIHFGDLDDPASDAGRLSSDPRAFRLLESLRTEPAVWYLSDRPWVRQLGETALRRRREEEAHG
jgi:molybdopterin-containing oxidoreductase family iron-sulfur binding subunit